MREVGYYWVKQNEDSQWEVGHYQGSDIWWLTGWEHHLAPSELFEIKPERLEGPK